MPIIARTQTQNQQLDEYPQAAQAFQMALGIVDAAQRNRQLTLAETGQAASIRQGDEQLSQGRERIGIANRQLDFRDQQRADQNQAASDLAQGQMALLGGQPGIQGPPVPPGVDGDNTDFEIEAVRYTASQMKSPQAQAQFLQDAAQTLKQRRVQKDSQAALSRISSSLRSSAAMPGGEQFAPHKERFAQMLDAVPQMDPEQGEIVLREAMQGLAQVEKMELEHAQLISAQTDGLAMLDQLTGTLPLGSPLKSKLMGFRGIIAGADKPQAVSEAMSKAFNLSIDYEPPVIVEIDGKLTEMTPKAYADYAIERERNAIEREKIAQRERMPVGMNARGLTGSTNESVAEKLLGVQTAGPNKGKIYAPKLNPDGTPKIDRGYGVGNFRAGGGDPVMEWRLPTAQEWESAIIQAGEVNRRGIGVEGIPQNQPQMRQPEPSQAPAADPNVPPPGMTDEQAREWYRKRSGG